MTLNATTLYEQLAAQSLGAPLHSKLIPGDNGCCLHQSRNLRFRARATCTTLVRLVARQRAAHQVLDHGSILNDPSAMKILHEDESEVLHLPTHTPWPVSDVYSLPHEAGLPRCFVRSCRKRDSADRHPWRRTRHFSLSGIPMAHYRSVSMR